MKKALPKIKKSLKSFILNEDAKVIDKTFVKVALTASFITTMAISQIDEANAEGHSDSLSHNNNLYIYDKPYGYNGGVVNFNEYLFNPTEQIKDNIAAKSINAIHNNVINHNNNGHGFIGHIATSLGINED